jgi:hypothetical protein
LGKSIRSPFKTGMIKVKSPLERGLFLTNFLLEQTVVDVAEVEND